MKLDGVCGGHFLSGLQYGAKFSSLIGKISKSNRTLSGVKSVAKFSN